MAQIISIQNYIHSDREQELIPLLVYGTLMKGERAHHMVEGFRFDGRWLLRDYAMYHLGSYPGIVPQKGETVMGEVYWVDREALARMDEYEDEGSLYHRRTVNVEQGGARLDVQIYVYARSVEGFPLLTGGKAPPGIGVEGHLCNWKEQRIRRAPRKPGDHNR